MLFRTVSAGIPLTAFLSCSLMQLGEFDLMSCDEGDSLACAEASRKFPLDPRVCAQYVCKRGRCVEEVGTETCEGTDQDCDGHIDNDVTIAAHEASDSVTDPVLVASTSTSGETFAVVDKTGNAWRLLGRDVTSAQLRYAGASDDGRCPDANGNAALCYFDEVALAGHADQLVYVSVNTSGCASGQIRIGLANTQNPFEVSLGPKPDAKSRVASNIAAGVDLTPDGCTGASRTPNDATGSIQKGATRPAVAALDLSAGAEGALAVWLGAETPDPERRDNTSETEPCGGAEPAPIEALGVYVPSGESGWLQGMEDGAPRVLGWTARRVPPAVVALSGEYLVAFATGAGIELWGMRPVHQVLEVRKLHSIEDPSADHVTLAVGLGDPNMTGVQSTAPEIGLMWSSGCGEQRRLKLTTFRFSASVPKFSPTTREIDSPGLIFRPQLLFGATGFSSKAPEGGWYVLWAEGPKEAGALKLARFTERQLHQLSKVTLSSGRLGAPLLFPSALSSFGFAMVWRRRPDAERIQPFFEWCAVME